jgi:NTE family protein
MGDYQTAIVFQGGGALGAYEYGVIKALYEERPGFNPVAVTGVSIGAINAALLVGAKNDPLKTLEHVWRDRFTEILPSSARSLVGPFLTHGLEQGLLAFGNAGMYQLRPDYLLAPLLSTSIYSLEPLRRTLREAIDLDKLNRSQTHLVLGAVNVATGEPRYFHNRGEGRLEIEHRGEERLEIEHVIASGSLPPAFPMTSIGADYFWDGGLFLNTPLSSAINCLEQTPNDARRELVVVELFPMKAPVPKNMTEVSNRLGQLIFASKLKIDGKLFNIVNRTIAFLEQIKGYIPQNFYDEPGNKDLFKLLFEHKKMDALTVITADFQEDQANAGDFSRDTIESRIKLGYEQAIKQNIRTPQPVEQSLNGKLG